MFTKQLQYTWSFVIVRNSFQSSTDFVSFSFCKIYFTSARKEYRDISGFLIEQDEAVIVRGLQETDVSLGLKLCKDLFREAAWLRENRKKVGILGES